MYKKVEYIESTGTQYIDTEIIGASGLSFEMGLQFLGDTSADVYVMGSRTSSQRIYALHVYSSKFCIGYGSLASSSHSSDSLYHDFKTVLKQGEQGFWVDGVRYYTGTSSTSINTNLPIYLFACNNSGTASCSKQRIYYVKIYKDNELVRDFVPVVDTDTGKAGLYDNVNDKFYVSKIDDLKYPVNYNSVADIVAGVENAIQLVSSTKHDDNSYTISGVPDFVKYKGESVTTMYANGNSYIGFGLDVDHFNFNKRDAAMYDLWKEDGTYLDTYSFFRVRWSGMSNYNSYGDPYFQTFDIIIFDTGDVMFYAVNIPTSYYDGVNSFADVAYNAPNTDSRYVTFYAQADGTYKTVYAPIDFAPASVYKYLVRDGSTLYTVTDGTLSVVEGDLTANLFMANGVDEIPDGSLLLPLYAPEVLCWTDGEELPRLTATVQGAPTGTHEIISDNINIGDSSIHGVSSIVAVASSGAKFFLSFDGGSWVVYDTSNNTCVASDTGMTAEELAAIPVSAWQGIAYTVENMLLKAVISGSETVTQIKFIFEN